MAIEIAHSLTIQQTTRGFSGQHNPARTGTQVQSPASAEKKAETSSIGGLSNAADTAKAGDLAAKESQLLMPDSDSLAQLVEMVNERPQIRNRSLQFSVHESTGKTLVRVYDSDTDELIRQFPPNELLLIAERIQEILAESPSGIMLEEKA